MIWTGIATKLHVKAIAPVLPAGTPGGFALVTYGVDAAGADIPNANIVGPGGPVTLVHYSSTGMLRIDAKRAPTVPAYLPYSGSGIGSTTINVRSAGMPLTSTVVRVQKEAAPSRLILTAVTTAKGSAVAEFDVSASGNAAPVKKIVGAIAVTGFFGMNARNEFWANLSYRSGGGELTGTAQQYSSSLNLLGAVTVNGMYDATVDREGNFYALTPTSVDVYASGTFATKLLRSLETWNGCEEHYGYYEDCAGRIGVDRSGNVYVATPYSYYYPSTGILEYAAGSAGAAPTIRTLDTDGLGASRLGFDDAGNVYATFPGDDGLWEYAPGATEATQILPGTPIADFTVDRAGNIYVIVAVAGDEDAIEVFPPGASVPAQTIAGPATGLVDAEGIAVTP
jgi:hypothetical protein